MRRYVENIFLKAYTITLGGLWFWRPAHTGELIHVSVDFSLKVLQVGDKEIRLQVCPCCSVRDFYFARSSGTSPVRCRTVDPPLNITFFQDRRSSET